MKDLAGREVKSGDLILYEMTYALFVSDNCLLRNYRGQNYRESRIYHDVYLITNPTDREKKLKEKFLKAYNQRVQIKVENKQKQLSNRASVKSSSKRGDIVKIAGRAWLYLGKGHINFLNDVKKGHIYLNLYFTDINNWDEEAVTKRIKSLSVNNYNVNDVVCYEKFIGEVKKSYVGKKDTDFFQDLKILSGKVGNADKILGTYQLVGKDLVVPMRFNAASSNEEYDIIDIFLD